MGDKRKRVDDSIASATTAQIPDGWKFQNQVATAPEDIHAHYLKKKPVDNSTRSPGDQLQFFFNNPKEMGIDFKRSILYFKGSLTRNSSGVTGVGFPRPIGAIFNKILIEWGSFTETIEHYDQLCSILERHFKTTDSQAEITTQNGSTLAGTGSMVSRLNNDLPSAQRLGATRSNYFAIGLHLGHLMQKMLPMALLDSPVTITLYLNTAVDCLETDDNVNPETNTYSLSECVWMYPAFDLPQQYKVNLLQAVNSSPVGVLYPYPFWRYQGAALASGVGGTITIKVNAAIKNLKHLIIGLRRTADTTTIAKLDKQMCFQNDSNLQSYQVHLNDEPKPVDPIPTNDDQIMSFWHYLLGVDKWNAYKGAYIQNGFLGVGRTLWQTTGNAFSQFLMHLDFDDFEGDNIISGANISDNNGQLLIDLNFAVGGPGANMRVDIWMLTEETVMLKPSPNSGGKITLTTSNKSS
jgi:hypothetical protein